MPQLPETGYLRLAQIIGNPKANPPIPALIPVSKSTWWAGLNQVASRHQSNSGQESPFGVLKTFAL